MQSVLRWCYLCGERAGVPKGECAKGRVCQRARMAKIKFAAPAGNKPARSQTLH